MEGDLYLIISTPNSGAVETLSLGLGDKDQEILFVFPDKIPTSGSHSIEWKMEDGRFKIGKMEKQKTQEWFLFFSNILDLADQIESSLTLLAENTGLNLCRIISFVDSNLLKVENFNSWMDGVVHFSDAICFSNRSNENGSAVSQLIERYKSMRYPLETYILSSRKEPPINQILSHTPRRVSHIFDPPELLEGDESPEQDLYLERLANGNRKKVIPELLF